MKNIEQNNSFIHWQTTSIAQFTYSINLILGFAIGALGFQVTILLNDKITLTIYQIYAYAISILLLLISIFIGVCCVINRLWDFRTTARAARMREQGKPKEQIESYREAYDKYGRRTWKMFYWQVGTFMTGIIFTIIGVIASIGAKLM